MDQLLASAPRTVVAIGALTLILVLIVVFNPPKTVCDSQLEIFRESQKSFLYPAKEKNFERPAQIQVLSERCLLDNGPGGCLELFEKFRKFSLDLGNVPQDCSEKVAGEAPVKAWLMKSLKLFVQLAWGPEGPKSYVERNGWLDSSDIALYCSLRARAIKIYGNGAFTEWRTSVLAGLPMAQKLDPETRWQRSLFSTPCDAFR